MGQVSSLDASDNPLLAQNQSPPEQNGGQPLTSTTQNEQTTIQQPPPYVSNTNTSLGTTRKVAPVESAVHKQLMDAVSNVDLSATKRHIKNGANVEVTDRDGITPLHIACAKGLLQLVQVLVEAGAKLDRRTRVEGATPLYLATKISNLAIVEFLISKGADFVLPTHQGVTPLLLAQALKSPIYEVLSKRINYTLDAWCTYDLKSIDAFVTQHGRFLMEIANEDGVTPLMIAAKFARLEVMQYILDRGVNVERKTKDGWTALHFAAKINNGELIKPLIDKGASINAKENEGLTPLHFATDMGHLQVMQTLLERGANIEATNNSKRTPLIMAVCHTKKIEVIKCLLSKGANTEAKDAEDCTALFYECSRNPSNFEITKLLLSNGASANTKCKDSLTSLCVAIKQENLNLVKLLIENNASLTSPMIAIIVAAIHNSELMVKYLVEIGQDVNASSVTGSTPLYQAASNNNVSLVKFLLSKGADVTHRTKEGRTSLYITKNPEIAKMLLEKGADINSVTNDRNTPLMRAAETGQLQMVHFLLDMGADKHITNNTGKTAVELSTNNQISQLLMSHTYRTQSVALESGYMQMEMKRMQQQQQEFLLEVSREQVKVEQERAREKELLDKRIEQEMAIAKKRVEEEAAKEKEEREKELARQQDMLMKLYSLRNETPSLARERGKRIALLIGNAEYTNVPALKGPTGDVELISKKLRLLGFDDVTVERNMTTKSEMKKSVDTFVEKLQDADTQLECCFFYYAGHGLQYQGNNYLLPTNLNEFQDLGEASLSLTEVIDGIEEVCDKNVAQIVIIDACRDEWKRKATRSVIEVPQNGFAEISAKGGTFLVYSTAPGKKASDTVDGTNSPFANALCTAMQPGVELVKVYRLVNAEVQRLTGGNQTAYLSTCLASELYF